jgi:serine/threonine-protein kinase
MAVMASSSGNLLAGRYRTIKRLGSGGMATVFLAEDQRLHREVAVKRMHAESPDEVAKRFQREAHLGATLNHPNIVSIFDIEADDENVLIVMEYVSGGTLKDALARGPLPRQHALKVLKGVGAALDYAHEHGVVHRDVKPANVLLDAEGRAKLADLGIATAAEVTSITRTGAVLGTAAYMAPERLDGEPGGPAVDIYALATVAYEVLTGHKARQGRSAVEVAHMVMSAPPPDLSTQMPDAPQEAVDVLARGMARDPGERPASAGELVRELCQAFENADATDPVAEDRTAATAWLPATDEAPRERPVPTRASAGPPSDRRWLLPVAGLVAALLAVAVILALAGGDDGDGGGSGEPSAQDSGDVRGQDESGGSSGEGDSGGGAAGGDSGGGAGGVDSPAEALRAFYTRAADDEFESAWELAGPGVREQLGGYDSFVGTLRSLESIEFPTLRTQEQSGESATVQFDSVATHPDRIDRCSGTAELASSGGGWRIERLNVGTCDQEPRGGETQGGTPGKGPDDGRRKKAKKPKKRD